MDKKFIEQFGNEILCYQINTARQKKRAVKTAQEKMLLQLNKEQKQIGRQLWNAGYVELHPPIVKGWKRYFVLRTDVARSSESVFYQNILNKVNTVEYCNRKDFKRKPRYGNKKKNWELIQQTVLQPSHSDFLKLDFSEKEKALFEERYVKHKWRNEMVKAFVFKEPWRFVPRVRKNVITKVKAVEAGLEGRQDEIRDYLQRTNKTYQLSHLLGDSVNRWKRENGPKPKYLFKEKTFAEIMDGSMDY